MGVWLGSLVASEGDRGLRGNDEFSIETSLNGASRRLWRHKLESELGCAHGG